MGVCPVNIRVVFLDRDGVLNRAIVRDGRPYPPATLTEFDILPDTEKALRRLKERGFLLIVVTNQPDVRRGLQSRQQVEAMHAVLKARLPIDDIFVCYHDSQDACNCRKPKAGLLLEAAQKYALDLPSCFLIGDRWRDADAGRAAGCKVIFIDYGYRERKPCEEPDATVTSLEEAVDWIIGQSAST